jgi:hypothetical protein
MRIFSPALWLIILLAGYCFAQENTDSANPSPEPPKAIKFDEFGDIRKREFVPRMEKFFTVLNEGDKVGYIVFYTSFNQSPFKQSSYFTQWRISTYLSIRKCHNDVRISIVHGPAMEKMRTELWIGAPGSDLPPIDHAGLPLRKQERMPELIISEHIDLDDAKIRRDDEEPDASTDAAEADEEDDPADDPEADKVVAQLRLVVERNSEETDISFGFLKNLKANSGRLIFYLDDAVYDLQKSRAIVEQKLRKAAPPDIFKRVKIIFGGYRDNPSIEVWDVLPGGIEPEPLPDEKIETGINEFSPKIDRVKR